MTGEIWGKSAEQFILSNILFTSKVFTTVPLELFLIKIKEKREVLIENKCRRLNVKAVSPAHWNAAMTWNCHLKEFTERGFRRFQVLEHLLLAHLQAYECCTAVWHTKEHLAQSSLGPRKLQYEATSPAMWNITALWEKVPLLSYSDTWSQNREWRQTSWPLPTGNHRREAGCTHRDTSFIHLSFQGDSVLQVYKPGDKMLCVKHRNEQCHLSYRSLLSPTVDHLFGEMAASPTGLRWNFLWQTHFKLFVFLFLILVADSKAH